MGLIFTLRMLSDLSMYLCAACTIGRIFTLSHLPMVPLLILTGVSGLCFILRDVKNTVLRLSPLALMLLCGFFIYGIVDAVVLLPAMAFCALTCYRKLFFEDRHNYKDRFVLFAKVLFPVVGVGALLGRSTVEGYTLPFALLTLVTGVYLLQMLRQSDEVLRQRRFRLLNLAVLVGAVLIGLILSTPALLAGIQFVLGAAYRYVLAPIFLGVAYIFVGLAWLLGPLFNWLKNRQVPEEPQVMEESPFANVEEFVNTPGPVANAVLNVVIAAAVIGLMFLAWKLLRRMLGYARLPGSAEVGETRSRAEQNQARRRARLSRSPRDQVRAAFRKLLLLCRTQGVAIVPNLTSRDAADHVSHASWGLAEPPHTLREIYIKARYSDHDITKQDAHEAKAALAAIRQHVRKTGL